MKRLIWLLPLILVFGLAACAKPPKAAMDAAEAAYARASKAPDVAAYAPDELQRAKKALDQMHNEAASRRYDQAKASAAEATAGSDAAIASAQTNKERAKTKAEELIAAVKLALPQTSKILTNALRVSKAKIDRASKLAAIAGAKAALADAETALSQGDYLGAIDKAGTAQRTLADMQSELGAAVQAATRKK